MLEFIQPKKGNIISFRTSGNITEKDVEEVKELIEAKSVNYRKLRLHAVIEGFKGYASASALWNDLKASFSYFKNFERASIVTDKNWIENMSELADRIVETEIKVFDRDEQGLAAAWIQEGSDIQKQNV